MRLRELVRLAKTEDKLPGGLGDHRPDSDFDPKQLEMGIKVEMEHTTDPELAKEITKDHLAEDPQYYTKLKTIEPHHGNVEADQDSKVDQLQSEIEEIDDAEEQLQDRMDALTGPDVEQDTAEVIRTSIQRRIDALDEDRQELQRQVQRIMLKKCKLPGGIHKERAKS